MDVILLIFVGISGLAVCYRVLQVLKEFFKTTPIEREPTKFLVPQTQITAIRRNYYGFFGRKDPFFGKNVKSKNAGFFSSHGRKNKLADATELTELSLDKSMHMMPGEIFTSNKPYPTLILRACSLVPYGNPKIGNYFWYRKEASYTSKVYWSFETNIHDNDRVYHDYVDLYAKQCMKQIDDSLYQQLGCSNPQMNTSMLNLHQWNIEQEKERMK